MELTVLVDNNTLIDHYFEGEPGLSFLLIDDGKKILFDLGYSDLFLKNANRMGLRLDDVDTIVFSHGHIDHTGGIFHFLNHMAEASFEKRPFRVPEIICHPLALEEKNEHGACYIGTPVGKKTIERCISCRYSKDPYWITDNLVFLGEIPKKIDFESRKSIGKVCICGKEEQDILLDDSALAYRTDKGIVIITGCSHAGICNIVSHAKKICNEERIIDIIGGLHLLNPDREVMGGTVDYFRKNKITAAHACHCTDLASKIELSKACKIIEVGVGMTLKY